MGEGLAKGINAAASAYSDYKQAKTSNAITKLLFDDPQYRQMVGIKSDEEAAQKKAQLADTIDKYGQLGGAMFSQQYLRPIQEYHALGRQYEEKLKLATALSDPEAQLKRAQAKEAEARAAALGRKATPPPMLDFKGVDWNAPAQPEENTNVDFGMPLFPRR